MAHGSPRREPGLCPRRDRSFEVDTVLQLMEEIDPTSFHGLRSGRSTERSARSATPTASSGSRTRPRQTAQRLISIMKLFQEIVGGYSGWTAFTGEKDLGNVDGIVLIDEIDAHIHPTWQARILPLLRRFFPRTTFYVCTHSPLIVATTEAGEAYELVREDKRVTANPLGNPRDWYLADLCEVAFHVTPPPVDDSVAVPTLLLDFSIQVKDYSAPRTRRARRTPRRSTSASSPRSPRPIRGATARRAQGHASMRGFVRGPRRRASRPTRPRTQPRTAVAAMDDLRYPGGGTAALERSGRGRARRARFAVRPGDVGQRMCRLRARHDRQRSHAGRPHPAQGGLSLRRLCLGEPPSDMRCVQPAQARVRPRPPARQGHRRLPPPREHPGTTTASSTRTTSSVVAGDHRLVDLRASTTRWIIWSSSRACLTTSPRP